jgi:hypothetical protein
LVTTKHAALYVLWAVSFYTLTLSGCKKEIVLPEGVIYLQIKADGTFSSYSDNNDGIPVSFNQGTFYECIAGSYNYSAKIGNFSWTNKTYTLSTPADGKRRNYTLSFITTSSGMSSTIDYDDIDQ